MLALLMTLLVLALAPAPPNVAGTWALNFVYKDGTHTQGYCTFQQAGNTLTGGCGSETAGGSALSGAIVDRQVTWQVEEGPSYTAALDDLGTFMKGTFTRSGEGIFTAMKTKL
jgi:hypothetical protein